MHAQRRGSMPAEDKVSQHLAVQTLQVNNSIYTFSWYGEIVSVFFNPTGPGFHVVVGHSEIENEYLQMFISEHEQELRERAKIVEEDSESWD